MRQGDIKNCLPLEYRTPRKDKKMYTLLTVFMEQIPGGGVGQFNACTDQYGAPANGWGQRYGGVSSRAECDGFPAKLKTGCYWRFDWFKGADNPSVSFRQVTCPAEITNKSGCRRQ